MVKPKFKVGDEAIYFHNRVEDEITFQRCNIISIDGYVEDYRVEMLGRFGMIMTEVDKSELLTQEEAAQKFNEWVKS